MSTINPLMYSLNNCNYSKKYSALKHEIKHFCFHSIKFCKLITVTNYKSILQLYSQKVNVFCYSKIKCKSLNGLRHT